MDRFRRSFRSESRWYEIDRQFLESNVLIEAGGCVVNRVNHYRTASRRYQPLLSMRESAAKTSILPKPLPC